jgi:predicted nucleic acid-binding protein
MLHYRSEPLRMLIRNIFIAATALTYDLPLMTLNTGHFDRVERLQLLAPVNV